MTLAKEEADESCMTNADFAWQGKGRRRRDDGDRRYGAWKEQSVCDHVYYEYRLHLLLRLVRFRVPYDDLK